MKSLLFIGMDFHNKTGSARFLLELLKERFEVNICLVDLCADDPYAVFKDASGYYDVLICYQVMPPRKELDRYITYDHAAFFPMLDGCPSIKKAERWYVYRDFQIISFSSKLWEQLTSAGFSAKYIQFFPEPLESMNLGDKHSAFLWARREEINCSLVEHLLSETGLDSMHVHKAPDPGVEFVPPPVESKVKYTYSVWYPKRSDMITDIERSAYYIAPRQKEGIGMSFLEAMALGRCVVASDQATMNEYIEHGKTGLLYDLKRPLALEPHDLRGIQRQTQQFMDKGYQEWEINKYKIIDWLYEPVKVSILKISTRMFLRFFRSPVKTIKALLYCLGIG